MCSQNQGLNYLLRQVQRIPVYCLDGCRCREGMSLIWAFVWNVGTLYVMLRENLISETREGGKYQCMYEGRIIPY